VFLIVIVGSQPVCPTHRSGPVAVLGPLFRTSPSIELLSWTPGATTVGNMFSGVLPYLGVHTNYIWTLAYIIIYLKCWKIPKNSKNRMEIPKNSKKNSKNNRKIAKNSRENLKIAESAVGYSHG